MRITRRLVIGGATAGAASPAAARFLPWSGGGPPAATTMITAVNLSSNTFVAQSGNAGTVIGTATVTTAPPGGSVTWSKTGADSALFSLNSSTGVLAVGGADVTTVRPYNINIIATNAAYGGSPFTQAEVLNGIAPGGLLAVNQNATRPLGAAAPFPYNDYVYPAAGIVATITGGPAGVNNCLQFWSASTGYVAVPWYLNNTTSPPGSGIANAVVTVPSVQGILWNPSNSNPPTPPVLGWELRFLNHPPGGETVLATQIITIDVLNGRDQAGVSHHARQNPFFPILSTLGQDSASTVLVPFINSGRIGGAQESICAIVAGTIQVGSSFHPNIGSYFPGLNTVKLQYTVDDIPIGPVVTGPATSSVNEWFLNINTTTVSWNGGTGIPDGTHCLGVILVDTTTGSTATQSLPYYYRCQQLSFIVHNTGTSLATLYASPMVIPTLPLSFSPSIRMSTSKADFVTWPGFTAVVAAGGTHNTVVPNPLPQSGVCPPASDPASPMHSLSPSAMRNNNNWFQEGLSGATSAEYISNQRWFTTLDGGVFAYNYNVELGQTLEGDYTGAIKHFNFDGSRCDNMTDPLSSSIDGHDGTYWIVFEMFGRIIKITHGGVVTTLAGGTTDRTKLGLCNYDSTFTESNIDAYLIQHGTIVSPTFGDLRGINLGCWDLTDPTPGNSLIVPNPVNHQIVKVTGLVSGPVTMHRIAGQDSGLGGVQVNTADNGGFVDGPATEFVTIGTSTVASCTAGTISGTTFTVSGSVAGTFALGQPLHGTGVTAGTLIISGSSPSFQVNISQTVTSTTITGSTPVALMAGPYSVDMADGIVGPDPKGTIYIADYQNSAIRKLAFDSGSSSWTTMTTLFGNQNGVIRWGPAGPNVGNPIGALLAGSPPINLTSAVWSAGVLTVVTASPIVQAGVSSPYNTIQTTWSVSLAGLTNTGSGGAGAVNGFFQILAITDPSHFTISMPAAPGVIGTVAGGNLVYYSDDVYMPASATPRPLNHGGANEAYIPLPQTALINSTGKLIISSTWSQVVSTVDLAASTIVYTGQWGCGVPNTRLNNQSDRARNSFPLNFQISWLQIAVDRGVAGDVSAIGCVGPKDDVFLFDANGVLSGSYWRVSADGLTGLAISTNPSGRMNPIPNGLQDAGHYSWMVSISRHQGRCLSSGVSDGGVVGWRIINPSEFTDLGNNINVDNAALQRGYGYLVQGTVIGSYVTALNGVFPWGIRPGIQCNHGEGLRAYLGVPGHADSIDGLVSTVGTSSAALATYLKNGLGSYSPSPEFSEGGDDSNDAVYAIQRTSIQGSVPTGTAGGGFIPINPLIQRAPYAVDTTAPVISATVAARTGAGATTIHVTWTTDKPTWGVVCAGFASGHGLSPGEPPYHLFAREAFVAGAGNPSYGTSHSVTIQCFVDALTYISVIAKDVAGNNAISPEQTVAA